MSGCASCCLVNCCSYTSSCFVCCSDNCVSQSDDISEVAFAVFKESFDGNNIDRERREYAIKLFNKSLTLSSEDNTQFKILNNFVKKFADTSLVGEIIYPKIEELSKKGHEDSTILFCKLYFRWCQNTRFDVDKYTYAESKEFKRVVELLHNIKKSDPEIAQLQKTFYKGYTYSTYVAERVRNNDERINKEIAADKKKEHQAYAEKQLLKAKPELAMMKRMHEERTDAINRQTDAIKQHTDAIGTATEAVNDARRAIDD